MFKVSFIPMDSVMDLCMLLCVQLSLGSLHIKRLLLAHLLLCTFTLAAFILPERNYPFWIHLPVFALAASVAAGVRTPRRILEASACMFCAAAAAAGFGALASRSPLPAAFAGAILFLLLLRRRRNICFRWNIELSVEKDGLYARFPALIDTGNRLREHKSNLPVLIVEAEAMPALAAYVQTLPDKVKRTLPFGVLGGGGEISCFRADRILVYPDAGTSHPTPDCWVAVYPGRIPGSTHALAPPEFAEAVQKDRFIPEAIQDTARRFCYGIFKR